MEVERPDPQADKNLMTFVVASFVVEGIHCWPECPLEEVSFLRSPHRHLFFFRMRKAVTHDDRDVEIIMLARAAKLFIQQTHPTVDGCSDFGRQSCEMLAQKVLAMFDCDAVEVLEDNENGAVVTK